METVSCPQLFWTRICRPTTNLGNSLMKNIDHSAAVAVFSEGGRGPSSLARQRLACFAGDSAGALRASEKSYCARCAARAPNSFLANAASRSSSWKSGAKMPMRPSTAASRPARSTPPKWNSAPPCSASANSAWRSSCCGPRWKRPGPLAQRRSR